MCECELTSHYYEGRNATVISLLGMELDLLVLRLEYHHLRQDDDQALYWAARYTKLVSSPSTSSSCSCFSDTLRGPGACSRHEAYASDPSTSVLQTGGRLACPNRQMEALETYVGCHT